MKSRILVLFLFCISVVFAREFPELSLQQFQKERLKSKDHAIFAVLEPAPADQHHICRTLLYSDFADDLDLVLPENKDAMVVLYGRGNGDDLAVEKVAWSVAEMGYTNVRIFYGGIKEWLESGGRLPK